MHEQDGKPMDPFWPLEYFVIRALTSARCYDTI